MQRIVTTIFTLRHLAHEAGVPYALLRAIIARSERAEAYKVFKLKKAVASFWCESFQVYLCASSIIAKSSAMDPQTHPDAG